MAAHKARANDEDPFGQYRYLVEGFLDFFNALRTP